MAEILNSWLFTKPRIPVHIAQQIKGVTLHFYGQVSNNADSVVSYFLCRGYTWRGTVPYIFPTSGANYHIFEWYEINPVTLRPWTTSDLSQLYAGCVLTGSGTITISDFDLHVLTEETPIAILTFEEPVQVHWEGYPNSGEAATGTITLATSTLINHNYVTISSGYDTATFDFKVTLPYTPTAGKIVVDVVGLTDPALISAALANAINTGSNWSLGFSDILATSSGNTVSLINKHTGIQGNVALFGSANITTSGMSGGTPTATSPAAYLRIDNGDVGYLKVPDAQTYWSLFKASIDWWLSRGHVINQVNLIYRVKGSSSVRQMIREEEQTTYSPAMGLVADRWQTIKQGYVHRPNFQTDESEWTARAVSQGNFGLANVSGGDTRWTSARIELLASARPEGYHYLLPTSAGSYNDWSIGAPNSGEQRYQDVNTWLYDDTSYLIASATSGSKRQTFTCLGKRGYWRGVRWTTRFRVDSGEASLFSIYKKGSSVFYGGQFRVSTITWKAFSEWWWLNPFTGEPWTSTDLQNFEIGFVLTAGSAYCSRCALCVGEMPSFDSEATYPLVAELTSIGQTNANRCIADSLVWKIDRFSVGRGGFERSNPPTALPAEGYFAFDLTDPVFRGEVTQAEFSGMTAYYYCVVPPDILAAPLGELMLWARIVSSTNPVDKPGDYFPIAIANFPCIWHGIKNITVLKVALVWS